MMFEPIEVKDLEIQGMSIVTGETSYGRVSMNIQKYYARRSKRIIKRRMVQHDAVDYRLMRNDMKLMPLQFFRVVDLITMDIDYAVSAGVDLNPDAIY